MSDKSRPILCGMSDCAVHFLVKYDGTKYSGTESELVVEVHKINIHMQKMAVFWVVAL
jgi:hypothetical protein